jgi:DNA-binding NtrC family response regulator
MSHASLLILHPDPGAPAMLDTMLRALGHHRIEATSYRSVQQPPAGRPGFVLLGVDPVDPEPLQLLRSLCRDDHAPPFILLFTAPPVRPIRADLQRRAAAVLRFPLPASQLDAALAQALAASTATAHWPPEAHPFRPSSAPVDRLAALTHGATTPSSSTGEIRLAARDPAATDTSRALIQPLKEALRGPERALILQALHAYGWNRNETADALQICRSTLYHKMKEYNLL